MSIYDNLDRDAARAYDAGAAAERERVVQLIHLIRVLHKPVKDVLFLTCHGCDLGPHPEGRPEWPCSTAELVFTPEEIAQAEKDCHAKSAEPIAIVPLEPKTGFGSLFRPA